MDISILENVIMKLSVIPMSVVANCGVEYTCRSGEAAVKSVYQKIKGNRKSFKDLYNENWLIGTNPESE